MNTYQNYQQDERIKSLEDKFGEMCDNHSHDITDIKVAISSIKTDLKYLVWFMLTMLAGIIGLWIK